MIRRMVFSMFACVDVKYGPLGYGVFYLEHII